MTGVDPGIFYQGDPNFGSERTVELYCGKLLLPHTPSHQSQLHACYNSLAPYRVLESLDEKMDFLSNLLMCKRVQSKRKICAKVVNAKFVHPFAPLCKWFSTFGIYHLYAV